MQLCVDATRFGFGLDEAIEMAASKKLGAIEFAFEPFVPDGKTGSLSADEKKYLQAAAKLSGEHKVAVACLRLNYWLDTEDAKAVKHFQAMLAKLTRVASAISCARISFGLKPQSKEGWIARAAARLLPLVEDLEKQGLKLLFTLAAPESERQRSLKLWRPLEPHEWRDLLAECPGLCLSFSAADCAWQSIDYLAILPGIVKAIEHVEARDVEVNRHLLSDSGIFGPLWWRYRVPGKGQIDWRQLIEALKLYGYEGAFSIKLDDEFIDSDELAMQESLDASIGLLAPMLKY